MWPARAGRNRMRHPASPAVGSGPGRSGPVRWRACAAPPTGRTGWSCACETSNSVRCGHRHGVRCAPGLCPRCRAGHRGPASGRRGRGRRGQAGRARAAREGVSWLRECPPTWAGGQLKEYDDERPERPVQCGHVTVPVDYARPEGPTIARAYDRVGFDPRGVGRSAPISCRDPTDVKALKSDPVVPGSRADKEKQRGHERSRPLRRRPAAPLRVRNVSSCPFRGWG